MKEYVRLIMILLIPLLLVSVYSVSGYRLSFNGWSVAKITFWDRFLDKEECVSYAKSMSAESSGHDVTCCEDSCNAEHATSQPEAMPVDTCSKRILFLGDSMVEGLSMRFSDYAQERLKRIEIAFLINKRIISCYINKKCPAVVVTVKA